MVPVKNIPLMINLDSVAVAGVFFSPRIKNTVNMDMFSSAAIYIYIYFLSCLHCLQQATDLIHWSYILY